MKICLGSAQFGLDYGVTNSFGRVPQSEVKKILECAESNGINYFDTAYDYGNAEYLLGLYLSKNSKVSTKISLPKSITSIDLDVISYMDKCFKTSLSNLARDHVECLYLHNSNMLTLAGSELVLEWLSKIKALQLAKTVGVSIYETKELSIASGDLFSAFQLPASIYDQRSLEYVQSNKSTSDNVSFHARSVFLQGLLLTNPDKWPSWINESARSMHRRLWSLSLHTNVSLKKMSIDFFKKNNNFSSILFGVTSLCELEELLYASESQTNFWDNSYNYSDWKLPSQPLLDPRTWPS